MTDDFSKLQLHPSLLEATRKMGFEAPTPIQSAVIPLLLEGKDVIAQAQTGTGKTAAFGLPLLQTLEQEARHTQVLVLTPTRELAKQVADAIEQMGAFRKVSIAAVYGGQAYGPQVKQIKRGVDIVVGTPGRILDLVKSNILKFDGLRQVVLDEADQMLSLGFVEDLESILKACPEKRQTALFSATLSKEIRRLASKYLHEPESVQMKAVQLSAPAVSQRYLVVHGRDKLAALSRVMELEDIDRAVVFCATRAMTTDLADALNEEGLNAAAINGDLNQGQREDVLQRFRDKNISTLVATDVAARGLDIDGVSHVFNFDLPHDPEVYVHRIGRTGRAGKSGVALSLFTPRETYRLRALQHYTQQDLEEIPIPSAKIIRQHRLDQWRRRLAASLTQDNLHQEHRLIQSLVEEGHAIEDLAAAALWLAKKGERERPIKELIPVRASKPMPTRRAPFKHRGRNFSSQGGSGPKSKHKGAKHKHQGRKSSAASTSGGPQGASGGSPRPQAAGQTENFTRRPQAAGSRASGAGRPQSPGGASRPNRPKRPKGPGATAGPNTSSRPKPTKASGRPNN